MQGTFSPPPRNSNPDMHHGTCVTHVSWCMPGSLTSGFLWSRWRGKRSRHSRCMRNPQFCVSGKRPMGNLKLLASPQQDDLQCLAPRLPGQSIWFASYHPSGLTLHIVPAPSLQPGDYNVSIIQWVRPQRNGWHFADDIFKRILIHISVKFASKGPIYEKPTLVVVVAWLRTGDKSLPEPMMARFTDVNIRVARPQCDNSMKYVRRFVVPYVLFDSFSCWWFHVIHTPISFRVETQV